MSAPERACNSCHEDTTFIRRVLCISCGTLVHRGCRDANHVCYSCNWWADRKGARRMDSPQAVGPEPYANGKAP